MPALAETSAAALLLTAVWWTGAVIFYGRFYVQWIVSEIKKQSVVPIAFWYMSAVGSVLLLPYNVYTRQPGAAFGLSFNMLVYSRNLIHIWREKGKLTKRLSIGIHTLAVVVVLVAVTLTAYTWLCEYRANREAPVDVAARNWMWLGVWAVGQTLFFLRFLVQWLITEIKKRSIVPPVFWYLSIAAAVLQGASFVQRHDWVNSAGMAATLLIYLRNAWLIHRQSAEGSAEG